MLKVPYAVLSDGTVGFPKTAERLPGWKCPGCNERVVVKRGDKMAAHFAHHRSTTGCSGGESLIHSATKEWIAANASNPDFCVSTHCSACHIEFDLFRGHPSFVGLTEVSVHGPSEKRYRVDTTVVAPTNRIVANIEVVNTHKSSDEKMRVISAMARDGAFEVNAVDLVAESYPLTLWEANYRSRCKLCISEAVAKKRATAICRRLNKARKVSRVWRRAVRASKARVCKKFARRWLLLHRSPKAKQWATKESERLYTLMFKACRKCKDDIQIRRWGCTKGDKCNVYNLEDVYDGWENDDNGHSYHLKCSPNCSQCGQSKRPGKWCECEKREHRKCVDCGKWHKRDEMHSNVLPQNKTEWVCKKCSSECLTCDAYISKKQRQFGGKCYVCNRSAIIAGAGGDPNDGYCLKCGKRLKNSRYTTCYTCSH
jgi:hypothetical protein